ncbi:BolA protein [Trinorchestia longiramus]|nr:BolA protein [Trinorchestia longiramus]
MWPLRRLLQPIRWTAAEWTRTCSGSEAGGSLTETQLEELLRARFPGATSVQVQDISGGCAVMWWVCRHVVGVPSCGGCGAMYEVWVETPEFGGLSRVKQHRLVTETLAEQIKDMHGIRISTGVPDA